MKKFIVYIRMAMLVGLAILLGGCEGNTYIKPKTEELNISDAQLVEFIEEAIDASAMGLLYDVHEATALAVRYLGHNNMAGSCGTKTDSIIPYTYPDVSRSMGYEGQCSWLVYCNAQSVPQSIDFDNHMMCDYKSTGIPRLSSSTGLGDWNIALTARTDNYLLSGDYIRDGYYKLGPEWDNSYYYKITFDAGNLEVDGNYLKVKEGIIPFKGYVKDVTITGIGATKEFNGTVEFLEEGKIMVMMEGKEYVF